MEYLVTMTTHVPGETPGQAVEDVRAREAVHSRELAAQGHLRRLWRPPLQPGEWRSLGLFAAGDADQLEDVLASMPLRVWRTDEVTPLAPHPNDPAPDATPAGQAGPAGPAGPEGQEFLTYFTFTVPDGTPDETVSAAEAREAERTYELAAEGHLGRLWRLPAGPTDALGLWRARNASQLQAIMESLPEYEWLAIQTTPLTPHPSDPALAAT